MKNKKLTYILGIGVIFIWGLIIYQIFASTKNNDNLQIIDKTVVKRSFNDYSTSKDTSKLLLNYRDPFGLAKTKDSVNLIKHTHVIAKTIKPQIDWGFIKYSGYIQNPVSKKLIAILTINGKSAMMSEGEISSNVKLIKNLKDSVKVFFGGQTKFILIHKGA